MGNTDTHFGRKFKDRGGNYVSVMSTRKRRELSDRAAARELGVAHGIFQGCARPNLNNNVTF